MYHNKIFFTSLSKTRRGERPQEGGWGYRTQENTNNSCKLVIYRAVGLRPAVGVYTPPVPLAIWGNVLLAGYLYPIVYICIHL